MTPFSTASATTLALVFAFCGLPDRALAQDPNPPLGGDGYIFFVDGVNATVDAFGGSLTNDPMDAGNKVMQYNPANWSYQAFRFASPQRDLTANRDAGHVLHFRILVDPANAAHMPDNEFTIMLEDHWDGSQADDGSANLPFRLHWVIPNDMRDGAWHEVSVPLPPPTWQALEEGKTDGSISGLEAQWVYGGAWTDGTQGVALDLLGPNTGTRPDLWAEFEWDNVHAIGPFWNWEVSAIGEAGPVYLDDLFIGPADLDLSIASGPPPAMSGVAFSHMNGPANIINWTHTDRQSIGSYNVYFSDDAITDISVQGVSLLENVIGDPEAPYPSVRHVVELPHLSIGTELHYAVTTVSVFGVENPDVSKSSGSIDNPNIAVSPAAIVHLTEVEANQLFDDLEAGNPSGAGFPDAASPFVVNAAHSQLSELLTLPDNDEDLSAKAWLGYTDQNELWIYAEVTDDVLEFQPEGAVLGNAWGYDSFELGWGNYDVRELGVSPLGRSPHSDMMRGEYADYQFRIWAQADNNGNMTMNHTFAGWSIDAAPQGSGAAHGVLTDGGGQEIGYKLLAVIPLNAIQNTEMADAVLDPPLANEIRFIPFTISLNDADGAGCSGDAPNINCRSHQITWSLNPTVDNQWWNTPSQWQIVAMVGRDVTVSSEDEPTLPDAYALTQNYPNPFNPVTTIRFRLANAEAVTLRVFDALGREVATLLDGRPLSAGVHDIRFDADGLPSGVYLYRLEAGNAFARAKRMVLLK